MILLNKVGTKIKGFVTKVPIFESQNRIFKMGQTFTIPLKLRESIALIGRESTRGCPKSSETPFLTSGCSNVAVRALFPLGRTSGSGSSKSGFLMIFRP